MQADMTDTIWTPVFEKTPKIAGTIELIDQQRWLIENMLLMPKHRAWIHRRTWARRVAATTSIEGEGIGTEAVEDLARQNVETKHGSAEQANLNALRAYEFVDYLSDQADLPLNELVIRELNRVFMRGSADTLTPGVYRKGQNAIRGYLPPNQGDVQPLMRSFGLWTAEDNSEIHPIIRAGLAHIQLVAIHPFWDGNGRAARALMTLILQRSSFGFKKLLSVESRFSELRQEYMDAIERTLGATYTEGYDATPWLEFYVQALWVTVDGLMGELTRWHREMEKFHSEFRELGLNEREINAIRFALHTGRITRSDYIEITEVSPVTASRDLAHLVEVGLLEPRGRTRGRIYEVKSHGPLGTGASRSPTPGEMQLTLDSQ